jgi:hypothetical protein
MASVLQQLENNEAMLLMYLADELPADDRAEVERMLRVDAGLRGELDRLRGAYNAFAAAVERQDAASRPPVPESVAVRRVGRAMAQWHARRLAAPKPATPVAKLRYPWWAYPLAAAASIVMAFLVWWGNTDRRVPGPGSLPYVKVTYPPHTDIVADADPSAEASSDVDPATSNYASVDLLLEGMGLAEAAAPPPAEWEDRLEVAIGPTDNAFMMLAGSEASDDGEPGPDHDDTSVQ